MKYFSTTILILFLYLGIYSQASAQTIDKMMFRMTMKYTFNLSQLGVCLSLPKNAGFSVPVAQDQNTDLDMGAQTYYCFDLKNILSNKNNKFRFSLTSDDKEYILMQILPLPTRYNPLKYRAEIKKQTAFRGILPPIKAKLGELYGYKNISPRQDIYYLYYIEHEGYFYVFTLSEKLFLENKKTVISFLESFSKKNLSVALKKYTNRVQSGYYDQEAKKRPDIDPENKYKTREGIFTDPTTLFVELYNIAYWLPANIRYSVKARGVGGDGQNRSLVIYEPDTINALPLNRYIFEGITFDQRYSAHDLREGLGPDKKSKVFIEKKMSIDGLNATLRYGGSKYYGNMMIDIPMGNASFYFNFTGLTGKNIGIVDKIIGSIKFSGSVDRKSKEKSVSVKRILNIEPLPPMPLQKISIRKYGMKEYGSSFKLTFTDAHVSMVVPGTMSQYLIRPETDLTTLSSGECSLAGFPTVLGGWFGATNAQYCATLSPSVYKSTDDFLDQFYWASESGSYLSNVKPYKVNIAGHDWGIVVGEKTKDKTFTAYAGFPMKNCTVFFLIEASSEKELDKYLSLLHYVKIE